MDGAGGNLFGVCPDEEAYAQEDKGDGENLSHVQDHVLFKSHLRVLYELDEDAAAEAHNHEQAHEGAAVHLVQIPLVKGVKHKAKEKICAGLVQLRGVAGGRFPVALEHEAPGKVCWVAVNLAVEQVSKADEAGREGDGDYKVVKEPHEVEVVLGTIFPGVPD